MPHGFMARPLVISLTPAGKHELSCANFHESHRFTTALHADLLQQIYPKSDKKCGIGGGDKCGYKFLSVLIEIVDCTMSILMKIKALYTFL
jgi:hypothetical protein